MKSIVRGFGFGLLCMITFGIVAFLPSGKNKVYVTAYENVLGTSMEFKVVADQKVKAEKAEETALAEIDRLNNILSGYNRNSEFSRWMRSGKVPVKVSDDLYEVLSLFEQWKQKTGGALDASAETIGKLWQNASKENRVPSAEEIQQAVMTVKQQHYVLNIASHTVQRLTEAPLMLNSFAKSYILNKATDAALAISGVSGVVVNIGGDIVVRGEHTEMIRVSNPRADAENEIPLGILRVSNKTIATSGNYRRGEMIGDHWYSHIVDPRNGMPVAKVISATVIADQSTDAGALATAMNVLDPAEGMALLSTVPGAECMIVTADGRKMESRGWASYKSFEPQKTQSAQSINAAEKLWDPKYELSITLELPVIEGMRVHRPFVAVWVVDENKKPLRQIALWYNKPRWLNEMRSWYNTYSDAFAAGSANITSTTSATRSPGKYTLTWDGKDDNGNYAKQGLYMLFIEVAREHGTHQLSSQEIDIKKQQHFSLPGNTEMASAALDYRKRADAK